MNCPYCRKQASAAKPLWPFCSERCKAADFGRWAKEDYRIAGQALDEDGEEDLSQLLASEEEPSALDDFDEEN